MIFLVRSIEEEEHKDKESILIEAIKKKNISELRALIEQSQDSLKMKSHLQYLIPDYIKDKGIVKEMLFDLDIEYHDQTTLQTKIIQYLEKEIEKSTNAEDRKNRDEVIGYFRQSAGECNGLSVLWAYGRRVAEDALTNPTNKPKDDIDFFNMVQRMLILWNAIQEFSREQKADIERFISNVVFYQKPAHEIFQEGGMQLDLSLVLEDTKRGRPIESFSKNIVCSKEMLHARLDKIIKPKTLIFIGATKDFKGHLMSIYQNSDNEIYFYDPNSQQGELLIKNYEQLIDALWEASDPSKFSKGLGMDPVDWSLRNVFIKIYRFAGDPIYKYPTEQEFRMSKKEFLYIFKKSKFLKTIAFRDQPVIMFIKQLDADQVVQLLQEENTPEAIKTILVRGQFSKIRGTYNEPISPLVARYLLANYKDLLDELLKTNVLTSKALYNLTQQAKQSTKADIFALQRLSVALESLANVF